MSIQEGFDALDEYYSEINANAKKKLVGGKVQEIQLFDDYDLDEEF